MTESNLNESPRICPTSHRYAMVEGETGEGPESASLPASPSPTMSFRFPLGTDGEDVADAGEMSLWDSNVAA